MEIVSVYNDKGGVGKSSTALEIAAAMAIAGKRMLLIDNDPQGSLSVSCIRNVEELDCGLDDVYKGDKDIIDVIFDTFIENMFIVPAGNSLKNQYFRKDDKIVKKVSDLITTFKTNDNFQDLFDVVIFDNPPVQDGTALYCTIHADKIIIPVVPDDVCFDGLRRSYAFLQSQCPDFNEKKIIIIPTLVKNRNLHKRYLAAIVKEYRGKNDNTIVSEVTVTDRAEVPESISQKQVLYISHAASESSWQYKQICLELFPWLEKESFLSALTEAAESKKRAARERFKVIIEERRKTLAAMKAAKKEMEVANVG